MLLKGTLSDPPSKDDNVRFTTIPLKRLFLCASKGEHLKCMVGSLGNHYDDDTLLLQLNEMFNTDSFMHGSISSSSSNPRYIFAIF